MSYKICMNFIFISVSNGNKFKISLQLSFDKIELYEILVIKHLFFCMARQPYMGLGLLDSSRFNGHTHLRHTTVGRTPLDEGSARRRDLYLTTHNTYKRQTSMPPVGFEPTILVSKRPKTHNLDRTATGIGIKHL
jgi:hypothetical protein